MTEPAVAPYGSWRSPIRIDDLVGDNVTLAEPWLDGDDVYWLEGRPAEAGRRVLVRVARRRSAVGPDPGAHLGPDPRPRVRRRRRTSSPAASSSSRTSPTAGSTGSTPGRRRRSRSPRPGRGATPTCASMPPGGASSRSARTTAAAARPSTRSSTSRSTATASRASSSTGPDFVAAPRLSPDGIALAWLEWDHPDMPWDATRLRVAPVAAGRHARRARPRRRRPGRVDRPARVVARRHPPPRLGPERLVEPVPARRRPAARAAGADGGRVRRPEPGSSAAPPTGSCRTARSWPSAGAAGRDRLFHIAPGRASSARSRAAFTELEGLQVGPGGIVALAGAAGQRDRRRAPRPGDARPGRACSAGRARWPSTRRAISLPEPIEFPTSGGRDRARALLPAAQPGLRRAARGERPPLRVFLRTAARPRTPRPAWTSCIQFWTSRGHRGGRRGLRRQHRLRPRVPARSSTGRGASSTSTTAWPRRTRLVERGDVDPDRLAIAGGSAGGYTTLAALAFRDLFAAGISSFGVGRPRGARPRDAQVRVALPGPAGRARIRRRPSATASARRSTASTGSRCPVLVLQGLEDRVVPPAQAEAIVAALAANGIPYAYLAFEGEGHGFRGEAAIRRSLEAELSFLGQVFGFEPADDDRAGDARRPRRLAGRAGPRRAAAAPGRPGAAPTMDAQTAIELVLLLLVVALGLAYLARRIGDRLPDPPRARRARASGFVLAASRDVPADRAPAGARLPAVPAADPVRVGLRHADPRLQGEPAGHRPARDRARAVHHGRRRGSSRTRSSPSSAGRRRSRSARSSRRRTPWRPRPILRRLGVPSTGRHDPRRREPRSTTPRR